ncbi:predicted protein [Chaetomium globosum CBS 148.51]|uniref:Uncharacterized protein n=1 Tax=Chaetomium globosum (strain ATCC 6205 / CBS 148.51 / DSM 1962 / NBRC 6347 / NRRL 1970) TaxID=306901 RepID=Q2HCT4_CHAGB|nr:uncharacterized protein CHGG_01970 [Chaetomium globosum CBS 148.51]EAQ93735.1 predicted protein [Chaetomium globosum CBS 148.51]
MISWRLNHILTMPSDPNIPSPQKFEEIKQYMLPAGFPFYVLEVRGLSRKSKRMLTPNKRYDSNHKTWQFQGQVVKDAKLIAPAVASSWAHGMNENRRYSGSRWRGNAVGALHLGYRV